MNETSPPSGDPRLSLLLRAARPSSSLPPRFRQSVWRRIESVDAPAPSASWLDALATLILRPRLAMVLAAVILLAGLAAGTLQGRQTARHEAQMSYLASVAPTAVR
ncbi:MAG TPA: hypothetical protein VL970_08245 [Candidatus Acidoferrales bacterium]|nr:hypothetical protein [Candidatus Acidoferrales bacterium]